MSYNILNKNVNFQGATQGTIEDVVDTHSAQAISGSKDFNVITGSSTHVVNSLSVATHAVDHAVCIAGSVSASLNISASFFYGDGSTLDNVGNVSFDGSTANGVLTFKDADEATVESSLTFDGSTLDFKGSSISGSGNISGSAFYGTWAGATINGSQVQIASGKGIGDSSGLTLTVNGVTEQNSPAGASQVFIDEGTGAIKRTTLTNLFATRAAVTSFANGSDNRVVTAGGASSLNGEASLTFDGTVLTVTGNVSGSGYVSASVGWFSTKVVGGSIELGDAGGVAGAGLVNNGGELDVQVSGAVKITSDKIGITGSFADLGLSYQGGVNSISAIKFDPDSLPAASIAVAGDSIIIIDADDDQPKKESFADVVTTMKGNGLTATSGILAVGAGTGIDVSTNAIAVDVSDFMTNGADNRLVTATGTDAMNAEASLTFDGSTLLLTGSVEISGSGITVRGGEGGTAALTLMADQGDDAADTASFSVGDGGNLDIDSNGTLTLDSDLGAIFLKDNNVEFSSFNRATIETAQEYGSSLLISASAGVMKLAAASGDFLFASGSTTKLSIGASGNNAVLQPSGDAVNDIIFTDGDESGNEIGRFDGSATALLMAGTNKVMFNDSGTYINSTSNSQLDIVSDGSVVFANTSTTVFTPSSVHNFTGNSGSAVIPITATYQKIDANGSGRIGMKFGGAGSAGQFLIVENVGGETVTFDAASGTALITTNADNDTMMPGEIFSFISNGSAWFLIGGDLQSG